VSRSRHVFRVETCSPSRRTCPDVAPGADHLARHRQRHLLISSRASWRSCRPHCRHARARRRGAVDGADRAGAADGGGGDCLHRVHGARAARLLIQYPSARSATACSGAVVASALKLTPRRDPADLRSSCCCCRRRSPTSMRAASGLGIDDRGATEPRAAAVLFCMSLIVFFAFFYTAIVFNRRRPPRISRSTAASSRHPAGERTAEHIDYVLSRITVIGAATWRWFACCRKS